MKTSTNKSLLIFVAFISFSYGVHAQFTDFRTLHTEKFDVQKWKDSASDYHENGYPKFEYEDIGKGAKKRIEYYNDGSLLSEMKVIYKLTKDTVVTFNPDTYEEMVQITVLNEAIPTGKYLEYHKGLKKGKSLIKIKGQFKEGKKTGTWSATTLAGKTTKTTIEDGDSKVDHTDYTSYKTLQEERPKVAKNPAQKRRTSLGTFNYNKRKYSFTIKDGLSGVLDDQQNEILQPKYLNITTPESKKGIIYLYSEDGKLHIYDLEINKIIAENLEDIKFDYRYKSNIITKDNKKGIFDPTLRQIVVPAKYNHIAVSTKSYGSDKNVMLLYKNDGIDLYYKTKDGNPHLIEQAYQSVTTFSLYKGNYALVGKNGAFELLSLENLKSVFKFREFPEIKIAPSGHTFVKSEGSWSVYKHDFSANNPGKFDDFNYVSKGDARIEVMRKGLWGLLEQDTMETMIVPCRYDALVYATNNRYKIYNKKKEVGMVDAAGKEIIPMEYEDIYTNYFLRDKYWVKKKGKYYLFGGKELNLFDEINSNFDRNFYIVENVGKQGLYGESENEMIIPCEYDSIYTFTYGRTGIRFKNAMALKKDNDLYFANMEGKMLSEQPFKSIVAIPSFCEIIAKDHNGKSHVLATSCYSKFELPPPADSIRHMEEGAYIVGDNKKFGMFSTGPLFGYKVDLPKEYDEVLWWLDKPADGSLLIMAQKEGKWQWVDPKTSKNHFEFEFDEIESFYGIEPYDQTKVVLDGQKKTLYLNGTLKDRKY